MNDFISRYAHTLMLIEANINKPYIPASYLKGTLHSIREKMAYLSDDNTDKKIVISCSPGSGKSYIFLLFIAYYQKKNIFFDNSFYDAFLSGNGLINKSKLQKAYFIHEGKTKKLNRVNTVYQESLPVHDYHVFLNDSAMTRSYLILANIFHDLGKLYGEFELFIHNNINILTEFNNIKWKTGNYFIAANLLTHHNDISENKTKKYRINILSYSNKLMKNYLRNLNRKSIIENILSRLIKSQYLLLLLARIYIEGLGKSLRAKIKLVYDLLGNLFNCVLIASIPP